MRVCVGSLDVKGEGRGLERDVDDHAADLHHLGSRWLDVLLGGPYLADDVTAWVRHCLCGGGQLLALPGRFSRVSHPHRDLLQCRSGSLQADGCPSVRRNSWVLPCGMSACARLTLCAEPCTCATRARRAVFDAAGTHSARHAMPRQTRSLWRYAILGVLGLKRLRDKRKKLLF